LETVALLDKERRHIERILERHLPASGDYPGRIHEAIRYSVLDGGKRLRPIMVIAAAEALGYDRSRIEKAACSIEFVHCCSLVLDDLPSMDNALKRRGRPTTHRVFGVATGLLSADALLMHAFKLVADNGVDVEADGVRIATAVRDLATAVGSYGMVGGQHVDLETASLESIDKETLEYIQTRKTGALFVVAATIGGTLLGAGTDDLAVLKKYAGALGLAYQIVDDILDAQGDPETLGKDVGKDANKQTYVTVHGVEKARETSRDLVREAGEALRALTGAETSVLGAMAAYCLERTS